ncbi:MAG TPA: hypothetical protein VF055_00915 [Steroidobacteraceae bacterium]
MYSGPAGRYDPIVPNCGRETQMMKWVLLVAAVVAVLYFVRTRRNGRK